MPSPSRSRDWKLALASIASVWPGRTSAASVLSLKIERSTLTSGCAGNEPSSRCRWKARRSPSTTSRSGRLSPLTSRVESAGIVNVLESTSERFALSRAFVRASSTATVAALRQEGQRAGALPVTGGMPSLSHSSQDCGPGSTRSGRPSLLTSCARSASVGCPTRSVKRARATSVSPCGRKAPCASSAKTCRPAGEALTSCSAPSLPSRRVVSTSVWRGSANCSVPLGVASNFAEPAARVNVRTSPARPKTTSSARLSPSTSTHRCAASGKAGSSVCTSSTRTGAAGVWAQASAHTRAGKLLT